MDILEKTLKQIKTCQKASNVLTCILLAEVIMGIIFYETIKLYTCIVLVVLAVFAIMAIAEFILDKVSDTKIDVLKNNYEWLMIKKRNVRDVCTLLDGHKAIFLKGPYSKEYGGTAIIAIRKDKTVKVTYLHEAQVNEIFE